VLRYSSHEENNAPWGRKRVMQVVRNFHSVPRMQQRLLDVDFLSYRLHRKHAFVCSTDAELPREVINDATKVF